MDGYVWKRLLRRPWVSLIGFVIGGALCLLLCLLTNYRNGQRELLERVKKNYNIACVVTDSRGTMSQNLRMPGRYADFVRDEENGIGAFVRDLRMTKSFPAKGDLGNVTVIGVTGEACDEAIDFAAGGGWEANMPDFFESREYVCLLSAELYEAKKGQSVTLRVTDPYSTGLLSTQAAGDFTLAVVGWHGGHSNRVFVPFPCAERMGVTLSGGASADSITFFLKENDTGDALMEAASSMFEPVDPSSDRNRFALTVQDRQYKATVSAMEQNIRRIGYLLPLIVLLGLGAGFLIGFLSTKGEARTYALMRTLGMTGRGLFVTVLFEQLLLPGAAIALAAVVTKCSVPAAIFLACQTVGCTLALLHPVAARPTRLLRERE